MITIKDVAQAAGVSPGTVSKVLNGYSNLSKETIAKVNKVIADMNFQPNLTAKSMRTKKTNMIGIVVPDVAHPFFTELYVELQKEFAKYNHGCLVFSSHSQEDKEIETLKAMLLRQVDGILFSSVGWSEVTIQSLISIGKKIPLVSLNRFFPNTAIKSVSIDYFSGVTKAMTHLITKGHRKIAYISGHLGSAAGDDRLSAYRSALQKFGIAYDENLIFSGDMEIRSGYRCAREIVQTFPLPSAIVAGNDAMAIGAMKFLKEKHIRIPNDIAVIGFDDIEWCNIIDPPLTSLCPPKTKIAEIVAQMLLGGTDETNVLLEPRLILRSSTDISAESNVDW